MIGLTEVKKGEISMKTMTCKEMGGTCDMEFHAESAEEMEKMGKEHVHSMEDDDHKNVVAQMTEMMEKDPEAMKKWQEDFKGKFDAAPDKAADMAA